MTYEEAIAYWYGRIDFERKAAQPADLKLDRMRAVLKSLGDPHQRLRIIHVAGTKGKGSTSAMLASVLQAAGYRVGLFTSPHLSDVTERIQVDGVPISHEELTVRLRELADAIRPMESSSDALRVPTFFEIATALGFTHFVCRHVDVAIVEVGLGGRFDSTNVCTPLVSVITNISFDHMAQLGDKLALIAMEKAGIIKPGRPVVSTAEAPEAQAVIERIAAERHAPLRLLGRDFQFEYRTQPPSVRVRTRLKEWPWIPLRNLYGHHQAANASGVVAVVEELRRLGLSIGDAAVSRGLSSAKWPARLEVTGQRPTVLLDCAHNVASAEALVATIQESFSVVGKKHLILAVSSDKQVAEMLQIFGPKFDHFYLTRYGNNPRCFPPEQAASLLKSAVPNAHISQHAVAANALAAAKAAAGPDDLIAISGSVFLAGELRPLLVPS